PGRAPRHRYCETPRLLVCPRLPRRTAGPGRSRRRLCSCLPCPLLSWATGVSCEVARSLLFVQRTGHRGPDERASGAEWYEAVRMLQSWLADGSISSSRATHTYSVGRRKMLSTSAAMRPPTMTIANGRCESE